MTQQAHSLEQSTANGTNPAFAHPRSISIRRTNTRLLPDRSRVLVRRETIEDLLALDVADA